MWHTLDPIVNGKKCNHGPKGNKKKIKEHLTKPVVI